LILRKVFKIVATRCHILRLKCTKFDFGCGFAQDPAGGAYSAPPRPDIREPTCKKREGMKDRGGQGTEEKGGGNTSKARWEGRISPQI